MSLFEEIYTDKNKTREFVNAMGGAQAGNFKAFAMGFDFTAADFDAWAREAGFHKTYVQSLTGPASAAIAIK